MKQQPTIGKKYRVMCGWGPTVARLDDIQTIADRVIYYWRDTTGFCFISYDLDGTVEL